MCIQQKLIRFNRVPVRYSIVSRSSIHASNLFFNTCVPLSELDDYESQNEHNITTYVHTPEQLQLDKIKKLGSKDIPIYLISDIALQKEVLSELCYNVANKVQFNCFNTKTSEFTSSLLFLKNQGVQTILFIDSMSFNSLADLIDYLESIHNICNQIHLLLHSSSAIAIPILTQYAQCKKFSLGITTHS